MGRRSKNKPSSALIIEVGERHHRARTTRTEMETLESRMLMAAQPLGGASRLGGAPR